MRKLVFALCLLFCVTGCSLPKKEVEEISTETEVPKPLTCEDTVQSVKAEEMTVCYNLNSVEKFAPKENLEDMIIVYESELSFNYCTIEVAYMPNYNLFKQYVPSTKFRELQDNYVVIVTSFGLSDTQCEGILNAVQVENYEV